MPHLVSSPFVILPPGDVPKRIEEYVGRVNTGEARLSIAKMTAAAGWEEPAQRPEFTEYTLVLSGFVRVEHDGGTLDVQAGQCIVTNPGERIRYSAPAGAEYVAVCLPAFSPDTVHRE